MSQGNQIEYCPYSANSCKEHCCILFIQVDVAKPVSAMKQNVDPFMFGHSEIETEILRMIEQQYILKLVANLSDSSVRTVVCCFGL